METYDTPWVILRLGDRLFGLPCSYVMEMLVIPKLSSVPEAPEYVRGVMNLRDRVNMVVDLRKRLRMKSALAEVDELIALLTEREQDHRNWIEELEASVREKRPFKLATDPHKCKFGQWYDTYKATNIIMENHLQKFDEPHKKIHALALDVRHLEDAGKMDDAIALIDKTRTGTLALMIGLFNDARKLLRETMREIVILLSHNDLSLGISADSIESVEPLKEGSIETVSLSSMGQNGSIITGTAKTAKDDKIIMTLNIPFLFSDKSLDLDFSLPRV